jgi:type IV secretion system protein VirB10
MRYKILLCSSLLAPSLLLAQENPQPNLTTRAPKAEVTQAAQSEAPLAKVVVPAGTKILMILKSGINTRTAQVGNGVYMETAFPISINNKIVIPPGTYVQGTIDSIKRPGRVKGKAEVQFHFTTLIFPNGFTVSIPGAVEDVPGADTGKVKDKEGTIQGNSSKGQDAGTIATDTLGGAGIGALAAGRKGAGIGALAGGAAGVAQVLFSRGEDVKFDPGTSVEMVLQRNLELEERMAATIRTEYVPVSIDRRLPKPKMSPAPEPR